MTTCELPDPSDLEKIRVWLREIDEAKLINGSDPELAKTINTSTPFGLNSPFPEVMARWVVLLAESLKSAHAAIEARHREIARLRRELGLDP